MEKSRKTTTTTSFCVEVSRSCKSLQQGLSPHMSKFSRFTDSRWAFLAQTRIGYCCSLDLKAVLTMQATAASSTDRKNMDVMCITHVGSCFFTFRAFDSDGNEKTSFVCAKTSHHAHEKDARISREAPNTEVFACSQNAICSNQVVKMFSFYAYRTAVERPYSAVSMLESLFDSDLSSTGINVNVTNALPFCNPTHQLTVLARSRDSFMEFKVMYFKKFHGNRVHSRIRNGWVRVVRKLGIKHGDRCTFTLMDPERWSYELTITPGYGCSEFLSQVVDMADLDD